MAAPKDRLYFLTQIVAHKLKKKADNLLIDCAGITTAQLAALTLIAGRQPINQRHVAEALAQNESAVTGMINRLTKSGLVVRTRSREDGRAWLLEITDKGKATLNNGGAAFKQINDLFDSCLADGRKAEFAADLQRLSQQLDE